MDVTIRNPSINFRFFLRLSQIVRTVGMGRKRKHTEKTYIWCYYCDREFDDENTLVSHQVARHFKCTTCGKKLGTFRGLLSHAKITHNIEIKA